ncbi:MAG: hypothetical protein JXB88_26160 [Spirochaetales bacterium]|nr:hypothetical protein [Spirochaetales bacterium]
MTTCKTTNDIPINIEDILKNTVPPVPDPPIMLPVTFADREDGLWLSYADYRNLEKNIIAMREYIRKLETIVDFYTEE